MFKLRFLFLLFILHSSFFMLHSFSQSFRRCDTIPVFVNSHQLKMPWVGGHNFCQFSAIDLNMDGIKDLFVFDRTGNKITTYINNGTPNSVDYVHAPQYEKLFPHLENWALLIDYNCDGKEDIFTYDTLGGIRVYKNTSTSTLQFTLVKKILQSDYGSSINPPVQNIYSSAIGLPAITDMDGDGDLDILVFSGSGAGWTLDYHVNQSQELGYGCDSLIFKVAPGCWGHFTEVGYTNGSGCSAVLNSCRMINPDSTDKTLSDSIAVNNIQPQVSPLDGGSVLMCLDMDGDGVKELYDGQLGCCKPVLLHNGGTKTNASMDSVYADFPSVDPIDFQFFPAAFFLDVNNDNKRDLLACPNSPGISLDNKNIWYYENIGADNAPVFVRKNRSFLEDEMIDVGEGADPVFFDFDSDGLTDLLISNYKDVYDSCPSTYDLNVSAYKNIGTATSPKFQLVSTDFANLSMQLPSIYGKHLTFGDIDGDGDQDMFVGDYNGNVWRFNNTAGAGNPCNFVLVGLVDTGSNPIDVGDFATPQLIDIDRDGDLDLVIGERSGNLNYFRNDGTPTLPSFTFVSDAFGEVDTYKPCCTGYSVPFFYDDGGKYKLIVGSEASRDYHNPAPEGWIWFFDSIDGNLGGKFHLIDSTYHNIWEGIRMTVSGKDINSDGLMDLVIGNYCGGVSIYLGDSTDVSVPEMIFPTIDFSIYPNPTSGNINVKINPVDNMKIESLEIYNVFGEKIYENDDLQIIPSSNFEIDLSKQPDGIYFCKIKSNRYFKTKKIVVVR